MKNLKSKCRNSKYYAARSSSGEDEKPLLEDMEQGMSTDHLVVNTGAKLPQYAAAICATLGGFIMGTMLGWTSPTQSELRAGGYGFAISLIEFSLIGALVNVGGMVGALGCGSVADKFGRKRTIIALVLPAIIGYAIVLWAESPIMMMVGRIIIGLPMGAYSMVCPLYTNEISEISVRGTLGAWFQLQVTFGILFCYVVGMFVKTFSLTLIIAIFPIILSVLMCFVPETPYYLLMQKNDQQAKKALQWLRGKNYNINEEIESSKATIAKVQAEKLGFIKAFSTTPAKKGLVIGIGIMFLQQFSGINAVIFFASSIFKSAGSSMNESLCSIVVGLMSFFTTIVSTLIIDKAGRKPLLMLSSFVMALSAAVLGIYFYLQAFHPDAAKSVTFLPLITVCVFIIVFSLGLGPIPWMILSEIFPPAIKGPASSICCLFNWICTFIVTLCFESVVKNIGSYSTFWIFAVVSVLGGIFVFFSIPETKGKSLNEIQQELGGSNDATNTSQRNSDKF